MDVKSFVPWVIEASDTVLGIHIPLENIAVFQDDSISYKRDAIASARAEAGAKLMRGKGPISARLLDEIQGDILRLNGFYTPRVNGKGDIAHDITVLTGQYPEGSLEEKYRTLLCLAHEIGHALMTEYRIAGRRERRAELDYSKWVGELYTAYRELRSISTDHERSQGPSLLAANLEENLEALYLHQTGFAGRLGLDLVHSAIERGTQELIVQSLGSKRKELERLRQDLESARANGSEDPLHTEVLEILVKGAQRDVSEYEEKAAGYEKSNHSRTAEIERRRKAVDLIKRIRYAGEKTLKFRPAFERTRSLSRIDSEGWACYFGYKVAEYHVREFLKRNLPGQDIDALINSCMQDSKNPLMEQIPLLKLHVEHTKEEKSREDVYGEGFRKYLAAPDTEHAKVMATLMV